MSDYASPLGTVAVGQGDQVTKANALLDAASPASMYGRNNATCTGLTWGYHGGKIMLNGVPTAVASGTVALTASSTNYIEATPASGVVSVNTTGFTAGRVPLYTVTTGASSANNDWVDKRVMPLGIPGYLAKSISDANTTLTQAEDANDILVISGTLTAIRNVVISLHPRQRTVHNNASKDVQFIGATGTGVTVASGRRAVIYSDGTNVVRVTPDTLGTAPLTITGNYTLIDSDKYLICNGSASITLTLPTASSWAGREITVKTRAAYTVISASSNVKPIDTDTAGTAILAATVGKWATLVSDGSNWVTMSGN